MFRHILPVFPSAKFSQKISGQIMPRSKCPRSNMPQVKNAPGQKRLRSKMPLVKKCPGSKTSHFKKWPCELNRENTCLYKTPQRLTWNRISDWLYDPGQTSTNCYVFLMSFSTILCLAKTGVNNRVLNQMIYRSWFPYSGFIPGWYRLSIYK